jgi:hypothetical protein
MHKKYFTGQSLAAFIFLLFAASCKTPYDPPIKSSKDHFLVVDGFINTNGFTNIKLSRTRNITWGDTAPYINEINAQVIIEDDQNNVYPLYENGAGNYSAGYFLNSNAQYRLHITTANQKEYVSDFVPCKISPPIQEVGWRFNDGDVQVYVNTQDPNNQTHFYRWDYKETWEFHSQYYSTLKFITQPNLAVVPRTVPVFVCYREGNSSNIFLGSSLKLKEDVIHEAPLALIPNHDRRISVLYSTLVTQYALDSAGYNYWNAMKGNTENVGSIFDPQPNLTQGNIHCITDSSERVIGYISAGTTQQARLFISNSSLPSDWNQPLNCTEYTVPKDSIGFYFSGNVFIPISSLPPGSPMPEAYLSASGTCVDCTLTGSPDKPPFWP